MGLTLGTTPAQLYKSFVESTAFGSRSIMEHLELQGVKITKVIGVGGISLKSPYVMQTLSDVMNVPIEVAATQQAGAMGAAMYAAVASNIFQTIELAQEALCQGILAKYKPNKEINKIYNTLYKRYIEFGQFMEKKSTSTA